MTTEQMDWLDAINAGRCGARYRTPDGVAVCQQWSGHQDSHRVGDRTWPNDVDLGDPWGTCDWGGCDRLATAWRWSDAYGYLPVCKHHAS